MTKIGLFILAATFMAGCGGSSSTTTTGGTATGGVTSGATTVNVKAISGNTIDLIGSVWSTACYGNPDTQEALLFSTLTGSPTVSYDMFQYTSTNGTCTGTAVSTQSYGASVVTGADAAITGWNSGAGNVAPTKGDNSGPLLDTETYTTLSYTITKITGAIVGQVAIGDVIEFGYVADDTGTSTMLYRTNSGGGGVSLSPPVTGTQQDPFMR